MEALLHSSFTLLCRLPQLAYHPTSRSTPFNTHHDNSKMTDRSFMAFRYIGAVKRREEQHCVRGSVPFTPRCRRRYLVLQDKKPCSTSWRTLIFLRHGFGSRRILSRRRTGHFAIVAPSSRTTVSNPANDNNGLRPSGQNSQPVPGGIRKLGTRERSRR